MSAHQLNEQRTAGRWTKTQHDSFLLGIELYGKNWKKIQQLIGTRTGSQIRSHAQKYFLKSKKHVTSKELPLSSHENEEDCQPLTVIFGQRKQDESQRPQNSFFMNIMSKYCEIGSLYTRQFDFWDQLIDCKTTRTNEATENCIRKNSFITLDNSYESRQQTPLSQFNHSQPLSL